MAETLDNQVIGAALAGLAGWQHDVSGGNIFLKLRFEGFAAAFAFMTEVALLAERQGHHPDWSNSYDRVEIRLTTHDAGGVTRRDLDMAEAISAIAARTGRRG